MRAQVRALHSLKVKVLKSTSLLHLNRHIMYPTHTKRVMVLLWVTDSVTSSRSLYACMSFQCQRPTGTRPNLMRNCKYSFRCDDTGNHRRRSDRICLYLTFLLSSLFSAFYKAFDD